MSDINATDTNADFEVSDDGFDKYRELLLKKQAMCSGVLGGIGAAFLTLAVWVPLMYYSHCGYIWMLLGFGLSIGYAVRFFGKGITSTFGIIAALITGITMIICMALTPYIFFAYDFGIPQLLSIFGKFSYSVPKLVLSMYVPINILFCIGAIIIAYILSFKQIKE